MLDWLNIFFDTIGDQVCLLSIFLKELVEIWFQFPDNLLIGRFIFKRLLTLLGFLRHLRDSATDHCGHGDQLLGVIEFTSASLYL